MLGHGKAEIQWINFIYISVVQKNQVEARGQGILPDCTTYLYKQIKFQLFISTRKQCSMTYYLLVLLTVSIGTTYVGEQHVDFKLFFLQIIIIVTIYYVQICVHCA